MPRVYPRILPISKPNPQEPAACHLYAYLRAFPERKPALVDLVSPLFRLPGDEGDRLEINHWQRPEYAKRKRKLIKTVPSHAHSLLILPQGKFSLIDREVPGIGTYHLCKNEDITTSEWFSRAVQWFYSAYRSRKKDSFWFKEGDRKTGDKLSNLQKKHPELFNVLEGVYQALNKLPPGRLWYPEYASREREKASANRLG
ncbi:MAG: hypothetical protein ACK551_04770 [Vampirovibrionales bacterium]